MFVNHIQALGFTFEAQSCTCISISYRFLQPNSFYLLRSALLKNPQVICRVITCMICVWKRQSTKRKTKQHILHAARSEFQICFLSIYVHIEKRNELVAMDMNQPLNGQEHKQWITIAHFQNISLKQYSFMLNLNQIWFYISLFMVCMAKENNMYKYSPEHQWCSDGMLLFFCLIKVVSWC